VLPQNTPPDEVALHAQARLSGTLDQRFEIAKIQSIKTGKIHTKNGPVFGEQFLIVLRSIDDAQSEDEDDWAEGLENPRRIIH
jgi:hypothetical protein